MQRDFYDLTPQGRTRRLRRVAQKALESYDVRDPALHVMSTETNAVYRVDSPDGRYVLRVGRGGNIAHSPQQVQAEAVFLTSLLRLGEVRAPVPVPNRSGGMVTQVEVAGVPESRNCVLFRWLSGHLLDDRLTTANLEAYGALAGRLHVHAESFVPPDWFSIVRYDRVFPFDEPVVLFDPRRSVFVTEQQRKVFATAAEVVQRAINDLSDHEAPRVLHGDLHRWNVLVDETGVAAFDFEDLMWGWPVQDLGIALYYLHREDNYTDLLAAFRTGYERIRRWPDRTGREIETFIAGRALVLANDVELLEEPEYRAAAPEWMAGFQTRVTALLDL